MDKKIDPTERTVASEMNLDPRVFKCTPGSPWFFDKSEAFKTEIEPMMRKVADACREHGIALQALVHFGVTEQGQDRLLSVVVAEDANRRPIDVSPQIIVASLTSNRIKAATNGTPEEKDAAMQHLIENPMFTEAEAIRANRRMILLRAQAEGSLQA